MQRVWVQSLVREVPHDAWHSQKKKKRERVQEDKGLRTLVTQQKVCKGEGMGNEVRGKPGKCGMTKAKSVWRRKEESVVMRVAESFFED